VSRLFVNAVLRSANRIVCGLSSSVLINNARLRGDVERLGARDVEVIGTPLPREFIDSSPTPIAAEMRRVCFAGRLAPEKNVEHIITAARSLPQVEFVIGGDGPLRRQLEEQATGVSNLCFTGWLSRSELVELLDSASLLLLPSAFETFGSIALEAMARGRPALVSTSAGIHAWPALRPGLFAIDRPSDIGARLSELLELSPREWEEKSSNARAVALELNQRTIDHWVALLRRQLPGDDSGETSP